MCELQLQHAQFSPNQIKCCGSKSVRKKQERSEHHQTSQRHGQMNIS
jgi:hypothetical protein